MEAKRLQRWWLGACVVAVLIANWAGGFSVAVTAVFVVIYLTGAALIGRDEPEAAAEAEVAAEPETEAEPEAATEPDAESEVVAPSPSVADRDRDPVMAEQDATEDNRAAGVPD